MKPAIRVDNLSKSYRLGHRSAGSYQTLRESLALASGKLMNRLRGAPSSVRANGDFWALKDVSFEIQPGDVVGIIGRNGAGKSTLLKILSRIVEPTSGRAEIHGRMGSLLEVGTGFHPELTGRENIYLNGAILGMKRQEIDQKFDDIVAFAEIEQFLNTPVKRYSSGMYVRLAFSVAAHLNPDILVVDEVLAVGDQEFQRKCLGKMSEISRSHRTILLVSHNMAVIQHLCKHVAYLEHGRLSYFGPTIQGIDRYFRSQCSGIDRIVDLRSHPNRRPGSKPVFQRIRLLNAQNDPIIQLPCGQSLSIELDVDVGHARQVHYSAWIEDSMGIRLSTFGTQLSSSTIAPTGQPQRVRGELGPVMLAPGQYHISIAAGSIFHLADDVIDRAASFEILAADVHGNGRLPKPDQGPLVMRSHWSAQDRVFDVSIPDASMPNPSRDVAESVAFN